MYFLKGFITYPSLYDNSPDTVASYGEISSNSLTFSKDKQVLTDPIAPQSGIIVFHSVVQENTVQPNVIYKVTSLRIAQWIYERALDGTLTEDRDQLTSMVLAEFAGIIDTFECGLIGEMGLNYYPEWIQFSLLEPTEENEITLWLSDQSFQAQYDQYALEIVHPIVPYDDFFKLPAEVRSDLISYDLVEKLNEVQTLRADYPYTFQHAYKYDYVNPNDPTDRTPAYWIVIGYGAAGNNLDLINEQITNEILAGSNRPKEDWEQILPELFRRNEFIFTPFWTNYAVPALNYREGLYSPIIDPNTQLNQIKALVKGPGYTEDYIQNNYQVSATLQRSLAFAVVGNSQNRDGIIKFSQKFPDYILVSNDVPDFNRIDPETQEWMLLFSDLLKAAESMNRYTSIPPGLSRIIRDGVIYTSRFYKGVNYLVATKVSTENLT